MSEILIGIAVLAVIGIAFAIVEIAWHKKHPGHARTPRNRQI